MIYFDHNATSPLCTRAREVWLEATERFFGNASSPHRLGARADAALNEARRSAAEWLGCSPFDLVWTSGATEANNSVFHHASLELRGDAWVSSIEHPSVLEGARRWFRGRLRLIPATGEGVVDLDWLEDNIKRSRPAIVAVMAANNETGVLQPWREVMACCRAHNVAFVCDAAQWIGKMPAAGLGECDFLTGCAHKFGGPLGVGFMKVPPGFRSLLAGGEQEEGRRAGTENIPAVLAMLAVWEMREQQIADGQTVIRQQWRDDFVRQIRASAPEFEILGSSVPRLWNTVTALLPRTADCRRRLVVRLDRAGYAVSTGSACASGKENPSHVLTAMGRDPSTSDRMLRFSAGWETTAEDWKALTKGVLEAIERASISTPEA